MSVDNRIEIFSEEDYEEAYADAPEKERGDTKSEVLDVASADVYSMIEYGRPNVKVMMEQTGKTLEELVEALDLYQDPEAYEQHKDPYRDWLKKWMYTNGKLIPKLYREAVEANEKYGIFQRNVNMLKESYPKLCDLTANDLSMGSPFIPLWMKGEIIQRLLGLKEAPKVTQDKNTRRTNIAYKDYPSHVVNHFRYGTEAAPATMIIDAMINGREPVVHLKGSPNKNAIDEAETMAALEKSKAIAKKFRSILALYLNEPDNYDLVAKLYCDSIGGYADNVVDAVWVAPVGLAITPYAHQKNWIYKITTKKVNMLVGSTGSGKTLAMVAGAMELLRMDLCKKILFVIPNDLLTNFVKEAECYYPDKKYLVIYPKLFSRKKEYYLNLIRDSVNDVIFMASSSYDLIDMSRKHYIDKVGEEIRKNKIALDQTKLGKDQRTLKTRLAALEKRMTALLGKQEKVTDCFESLGIDGLFIDEAHGYKNVSVECGYTHLANVTLKGSDKCNINMEKVHHVLKGVEGREGRVCFATATPLKTSIAEQYVYQKYLSDEDLKYLNLDTFREWLNVFTEAEEKYGIDLDAQHMKLRTRLHFHNLTELHRMVSSFTDFYNIKNGEMDLPKCDGYIDVVIPNTPEDEKIYRGIAEKLERFRSGELTYKEYNPLVAIMEYRMAAMDSRHLDPKLVPRPGTTKTDYCVKNVCEIYEKYPGKTQTIFCDWSVPKAAFNIYDLLKQGLVKQGIPASEIAFIHDAEPPAQKEKLLDDFNEGRVRVMIGSTEKMGTGLNIQRNLIASHHFDCPWSPAQLRQRNGRIIRRGNTCPEVFIYRYIKSFDAYVWQNVEMKHYFISQYYSPILKEEHRDMDDIDTVVSAGEAVAHALENPMLKEYMELTNQLNRLKISSRKRAGELQKLNTILIQNPQEIERREGYIEGMEKDISYYAENRVPMTQADRERIGRRILEAVQDAKMNGTPEQTAETSVMYQGFRVVIPGFFRDDKCTVKIRGVGGIIYPMELKAETPTGVCQALNTYLGRSIPERKRRMETRVTQLLEEVIQASKEVEAGNPFMQQISEIEEELEQLEKAMEGGGVCLH